MDHLTHFEMICAVLIGVLSVARTARLVVHDPFPPMLWVRLRWHVLVTGDWAKLIKCQFCLSPYMATVMAAWFYFSDGHWTWWVINGVWGFSYLAAIVVSYDQPPE